MAGQIGDLAAEQPLLQDDYSSRRPAARKKKKKLPRTPTRTTEAPVPKHPGFKAVQAKIAAKEGVPMKNAGAILANASRNASPAAKKKNPALNKVKGKAKPTKKSAPKKSYGSPSIARAMGANC